VAKSVFKPLRIENAHGNVTLSLIIADEDVDLNVQRCKRGSLFKYMLQLCFCLI
jgi:hypothetical protein